MTTEAALARLRLVVHGVKDILDKSISYFGIDITADLEDSEMRIQFMIEAVQHSPPDDITPLTSWSARLQFVYYDTKDILIEYEAILSEYEHLKHMDKGEEENLLVRLSLQLIIKPLIIKKAFLLSHQKKKLLLRLNKLKQVAAEAKQLCDLLGIQKTRSKGGIIAGNNHSVTSLFANDLIDKSISNLGSDIVKDLKNLETTLLPQFHLTIQAAQRWSPDNIATLTSWLARLKSACDDGEAILHEVENNARREATKSSTSTLVKKVFQKKNLLQRLNKLKEVAAEANTVCGLLGIASNSCPVTTPFFTDKIFGRDSDRDDVIKFLLDEKDSSKLRKSYSVVAITGMGGAGKTILAQYIYNDPSVKDYFNLRMWLCLSRNFNVNKVTKEMIECASKKECPNLHSLGLLQHMLTKTLPKSSNIMVVLDDVWYDNDDQDAGQKQWGSLLAPFASRGGRTCKIVVTSRSTSFPMALPPEKIVKLRNLEHGDFKSLLRYCTIESFQISNPLLKNESSDMIERNKIVDQIAEKMSEMSNQPLAAKIIGNELCARSDIMFWRETKEKFNLSTDGVVVGNKHFITSLITDKVFGRDRDCHKIIKFATSPLLTGIVFGRDGDRDVIIDFLLNKQRYINLRKSYSVVAVTGMGGVGKTMLAQYVYNDERIKDHFGVRMWLCLSRNYDVSEITKEMIEWASGMECPNLCNLTELQNKLIEILLKSDNIMVVLDDVRYDNDDPDAGDQQWDSLLAPFAYRRGTCKIIVTSRLTSFPMALNPEQLIKLNDLALGDVEDRIHEK